MAHRIRADSLSALDSRRVSPPEPSWRAMTDPIPLASRRDRSVIDAVRGNVVTSGTPVVPVHWAPFASTRPVETLFKGWIEAQCPGDRPPSVWGFRR